MLGGQGIREMQRQIEGEAKTKGKEERRKERFARGEAERKRIENEVRGEMREEWRKKATEIKSLLSRSPTKRMTLAPSHRDVANKSVAGESIITQDAQKSGKKGKSAGPTLKGKR